MTDTCRTIVIAERAALLADDAAALEYWTNLAAADRKLFSGIGDFLACVAHYRRRA